jgi:iron(III) transport system permease protein
VPALVVLAGVLIPLVYLVIRAFQADAAQLLDILLRQRNLVLLRNTVGLTLGVLALTTVISFPLAWLTARCTFPGRKALTIFGVLPLAIPGYVMAFALLSATGGYGTLNHLIGIDVPRPTGYWGALIALSLATSPYLYLNLRSALNGLDASLEESARSLGYTQREIMWQVVAPQLRPAYLAGALLVGLHVLGDFGVVSLMRFETFSYAIYLQYASAFDRVYAAWLALMLLGLTGAVLLLEARLLRGLVLHRAGTGVRREAPRVPLGRWTVPTILFVAALVIGLVVPVTSLAFWTNTSQAAAQATSVLQAIWTSFSASAPAAIVAGALAIPLAYMSVRMPGNVSAGLERVAYFGYATPPLAFALALVFVSLHALPFIYQTLGLLIFAYAIHFLAEAIGPIRSALYQAPPAIEEAARALGRPPLRAFIEATFPLLRRGVMVSMAFVFLSAMKELPITFLLSPIGFQTLALNVWDYTNEAMFGAAAPYALAIVAFSAVFVGVLLIERK